MNGTMRARAALLAIVIAGASALESAAKRVGPSPTEIVVIGTVHRATTSYTARDLIAILERLKPDVILFELPADMMTASFEFKSGVERSLEQEATEEYVRHFGAKVRPYDIDGRNIFYSSTEYFARQRQCNQELSAALDGKRLEPSARQIADALIAANAKRDRIGASTPMEMNGFAADTSINEKQWLMQQGIPEIVRLTPALRGCAAFWDLSRGFWTRRNNAMLDHIKRLAKEFAGRRLVVLCGYEHRYYLRSGLLEWDDGRGYIVKEYWEYEASTKAG